MKTVLDWIRTHQADVSVLLFLAAGMIGVFILVVCPAEQGDEMMRLAKNIAELGTFANPFSVLATGPTAVTPPLYPFMLAGFMKLLRVSSWPVAAAVLVSILVNAITASLLPRISVVFYGDAVPGVIASILWLAVMPVMPGWDTSYTVMGLIFFCILTSSFEDLDRSNEARLAAGGGAIAGLLALLNPSSLLILLPWIGFLFWRTRADLPRALKYCGITLAVLCVFIVGWCGRNYHQLGAFVVRTNLGMTLYASNNDCAESSLMREVLSRCYQTHHPNNSVREAELLRSLGEVQYDRNRIADTENWVKAKPAKFLKLTMARLLQFWFPAVEFLPNGRGLTDSMYAWVKLQNIVARVIWMITAFSFPGLFLMARRREPVTAFVLVVLAFYPLMYYVVVSDMRYRYPVLWLSLLAAGYFISDVVGGGLSRIAVAAQTE